ncbi:hypothetical protein PYW08_012699 [Mythimna loreyi]|uniref:Uncharacterized protein n=1 Tax=Mythimna loreyi TaxID=667449 RepID=A0ACC2Q5X1_9NEOP|nr:hypothetical protein PYW08_012699 [Mythimna loreyi]
MVIVINSRKYKKRPGTCGIQGHLYETKLLSLIYFRALHNDNIQDFHLATNVDKLGSFDDICFRVKVKKVAKPLTVFIQAKHRENNTVLTLNSKSDLIKHFNSYLEIRKQFKPNNKDVLFDGAFDDTQCLIVIYTTATSDPSVNSKIESDCVTFLNKLIGTEGFGSGLQPLDDSKHAEITQIFLEKEMTALARLMAKCMHGEFKNLQMLNLEEVVLRYHVLLAQQVFDVSDTDSEGPRYARLRPDFFDINKEIVQPFKEKLCAEILKRQKFLLDTSASQPNYLASSVIPDINNEYHEIKHLITFEDRKFKFIDKVESEPYKRILDKINESQDTIQKTLEIAIKQSLPSPTFKVPAWFGNKDLTIRGDVEKKERKLIDLTSKIIRLIEKASPENIVIIDESLDEGFLRLNGGIASAVGNFGLVENPLHLNLLAEHILYNKIYVRNPDDHEQQAPLAAQDVELDDEQARFELWKHIPTMKVVNDILYIRKPIKWDLDLNLYEIYENFLENKLKIRFQEKNDIDLYKPENRNHYKNAHRDASDKLKKLAAYVVYNKRLLNKNELKRCEEIIDDVKKGDENTDIIFGEDRIKMNNIEITEDLDGTVLLKGCDGDEWTIFQRIS